MTLPTVKPTWNMQPETLVDFEDFITELAEAMNDEAVLIEELNRKAEEERMVNLLGG